MSTDALAAFAADIADEAAVDAAAASAGTTLSGMFGDGSPLYLAALERARARYARAVSVPCPWGWCSNDVDPLDGTVIGGFGPVECPCENLPGWRSERMAGRAKPQVPAKGRGRHGSRVQRSTARHALPDYDIDDFAWLAPRSAPTADTTADTTDED